MNVKLKLFLILKKLWKFCLKLESCKEIFKKFKFLKEKKPRKNQNQQNLVHNFKISKKEKSKEKIQRNKFEISNKKLH